MKHTSVTTLHKDRSASVQRDADGRLRHLITLEGLSRDEIVALLDLAQFYVRAPGDLAARDQSLAGHTVANLFFEPSTRTRVSFELAARRLGAEVVNLDMQSSSRVKGETVLDTIYTLQAMHADILVMRDAEPGVAAQASLGSRDLLALRGVVADDPFRAVQALPEVATGDDFRAEFAVRGLGPEHTGIALDGVDTRLLFHIVRGVNDARSLALINTDVLESATLLAGAYPQRAGAHLGQRVEHFLEGDAAMLQRQPRPHRPGRVILVSDVEARLGHGRQKLLYPDAKPGPGAPTVPS